MHQINGIDHFVNITLFGQIALGTDFQQAFGEGLLIMYGEYDNFLIRIAHQYAPTGFNPPDTRHIDIHQNDVRAQFHRHLDTGFTRLGFSDDIYLFAIFQKPFYTCSDQRVVISQ